MTLDILVEEVRRLAAESPHAIYYKPTAYGCSYINGDCGRGKGCILGQAAKNVWPELFHVMEKGEFVAFSSYLIYDVNGSTANGTQIEWLKSVQRHQDSGYTWSETVAFTDKHNPIIQGNQ